jgi:hypothetical protein
MFGLDKLFGSSEVIKAGKELIDDAFYTDSEKAEDQEKARQGKAQHHINLLTAYAPFKVAQRYIAVTFLFNFTFSFFLILGMTLFKMDTAPALSVISSFNIGMIMLTIVGFYFGGGLVESWNRRKEKA